MMPHNYSASAGSTLAEMILGLLEKTKRMSMIAKSMVTVKPSTWEMKSMVTVMLPHSSM
jgi:hypothetical protein